MDEQEKEALTNADFHLSMMNIQKHYPTVDWSGSKHTHATAVLISDLLERLKKIEEKYIK